MLEQTNHSEGVKTFVVVGGGVSGGGGINIHTGEGCLIVCSKTMN